MDDDDVVQWPAGAERVWSAAEVSLALDDQANRLKATFPEHQPLTALVMMTGGMYPAIELTRRLSRPLLFDYVHATRYRGERTGGKIEWVHFPETQKLAGNVLLIDDIFDEGYTMKAVRDRLVEEGARSIVSAVLAVKQHARGLPREWVDDYALAVPDRYVFGCGMDLHGHWRQLDEIWAVES